MVFEIYMCVKCMQEEDHNTSRWIWRRKGGEWNEEKGECVGIGMEDRNKGGSVGVVMFWMSECVSGWVGGY